MTIQVALHHLTDYRYNRLVAVGPHVVRLRPAPHTRTPITAYSLKVEPANYFINWQQDPQGNFLARLVFPDKIERLTVTVDLVAEMTVINPFDFFLDPSAETVPFAYERSLDEELAPYRRLSPAEPLLREYLSAIGTQSGRTMDFLVGINQKLKQDIRYIVRLEPGVQTPEQTLALASGSCRDSGWLLVQILRHLGFAARFVSGYLIQLVADQKPLEGPAGPTADFTDLHAWCEVYLPGAGWIGLDPTSGLLAGEGHIPLACSPEPQSAAPVTGTVEQCETAFRHEMRVSRIAETPRVTKPFDDAAWNRLVAFGGRIDRELERQDVRLTMGGEPTFVAAADPDAPEWNTEALGPTKRRYAGRLLRRLAGRFAPGHLLHYGQGKWYPGEQLPRWALGCYWRKDGEPIWQRQDLLAAEEDANPGLATEQARRFVGRLAEQLQVDPDCCLPAFEDAWYYLWKERKLPVNVDPFKSELADPMERARLARIFEAGLSRTVGYALPLRRTGANGARRWQSESWFVRPETLFLIPGDSPMGYRLPLDSLHWVAESEYPSLVPDDPMAPRPDLPPRQAYRAQPTRGPGAAVAGRREQTLEKPALGESDPTAVRTALCAEIRDGLLHLFLPPLETIEDFLALAAAIEDVAVEMAQPVVLEGYPPPHDPRLNEFSVTPDPGVIEVNIQPAASWPELVDHTTIVYDEARACGLVTEKFMLDGRHVGTGGGNHVTLGGPTAADSPLLRRPDLLKSLLGYWHNHPSLSYLFSGLFIGPTSQHPRIDEARDDSTYELGIAFRALAAATEKGPPAPWLVDRIFRDVLVDVTGNAHRTEFCIDKLFTPDSAAGRRGLLEIRAFEMPPHARMSLAQQALLRAIVAWVWHEPYDRPLARHGTRLHDEFMLPYFTENDFTDVLDDLRRAGYAIEPDWFAAHREFRFPFIGQVAYRGIELELRNALEPWHVTGEDAAAGGTSRFVDSSVERIQIKLEGIVDERHRLLCNGRTVPLRATGRAGEFVAGIRFRAWQPARALHPTITVHTPLVLDLYDSWSERSIGGCAYHVAHPGGRNFERFPVNANEAETRRRARFFPFGHTPGKIVPKHSTPGREHPVTMDLRNYV